MSAETNSLTEELRKIRKELDHQRSVRGLAQSMDLSEIEEKLVTLSEKVQQNPSEANQETKVVLEEVQMSYMKIVGGTTPFQSIIESQSDEANDNERDFESYIDSIHLEP